MNQSVPIVFVEVADELQPSSFRLCVPRSVDLVSARFGLTEGEPAERPRADQIPITASVEQGTDGVFVVVNVLSSYHGQVLTGAILGASNDDVRALFRISIQDRPPASAAVDIASVGVSAWNRAASPMAEARIADYYSSTVSDALQAPEADSGSDAKQLLSEEVASVGRWLDDVEAELVRRRVELAELHKRLSQLTAPFPTSKITTDPRPCRSEPERAHSGPQLAWSDAHGLNGELMRNVRAS